MRLRRAGRRGLSEIVGALMLVLIVVVAATAFSAFVLSYQKRQQAQQAITQARSLESLKILSVSSQLNSTAGGAPNGLEGVNISVASVSVEWSNVTEVTVDGNPVQNYTVVSYNPQAGGFQSNAIAGGASLPVAPREQFFVLVDVAAGITSSFYQRSVQMYSTQFIKVDLLTLLENDFTRTFVPPTAVSTVIPIQVWTGSAFVTEPEFDGSGSLQTGNDSIVNWTWTVVDAQLGHPLPAWPTNVSWGERAIPAFGALPITGEGYQVTLVVTNSAGLIGSTQFAYKH